jgi:nucleotide-binding universal stress UspA family protein
MQARPIVVGIDGSSTSVAALAHGSWQADRRGLPLHVTVCHGPATTARQEAQALAADLAEQARIAWPRVDVSGQVVAGRAGATLVRLSEDAALMVVGSRGRGGFTGLLLGSVGTQLAAHSIAPVIVIRPTDGQEDRDVDADLPIGAFGAVPAPAPVVVGIDGVPDSEATIEFAAEEAVARGAPLVVLYAWWMLPVSRLGPAPAHHQGSPVPQADLGAAEEEIRRMLAEATVGVRNRYPDLAVELRPTHALNPAAALLDASANAGLLVVSRHGGNTLTRRLFSSIGDVAVRHAACPVAVVPEVSAVELSASLA